LSDIILDGFTYHADVTSTESEADVAEFAIVNKRRVIQFVWQWCSTIEDAFWEDKTIQAFLGVSKLLRLDSTPKNIRLCSCWYFRTGFFIYFLFTILYSVLSVL